jgi:calcium-dependent protein kinase
LKREIIYLRKLDSPLIVKYYETYEDDNSVYLVMEHCEGKNLYDILARRTKRNQLLKEDDVVDTMYSVFQAVAHCHS